MDVLDGELARISHIEGGGWRARFSRTFAQSPSEVWTALTDPAWLPKWLAPGTIDLHVGGRARLDFADSGIVIDSEVTQSDPGHLLEYAWSRPGEPLRPLTWTLAAFLDGCRLTLTLGVPEGEDVARSCAGWDAHLDMLAAALEDVPIAFPFARFKAAREAYKAQLAAA